MVPDIRPKVSIIVPVYNVKIYLKRCLSSIQNQTLKEWECICVDDGSTDGSGAICDQYADGDVRFKVVHKENGGVSSARNAGIDEARGEFIGFVDADDWIEVQTYEIAYKTAKSKQVEIVQWNGWRVDEHYDKIPFYDDNVHLKEGYFSIKDDVSYFNGSVWNKLFSSDLFSSSKLRFPEGIKLCEDRYISFMCLVNAGHCYEIDSFLYYYYERNDSAVHSINKEMILQEAEVIKMMETSVNESDRQYYEPLFIRLKSNVKFASVLRCFPPNYDLCRSLFPEVNKHILHNDKIGKQIFYKLTMMHMDKLLSLMLPFIKSCC